MNVGTDHDTPVFAVTSIGAWWNLIGRKRYPEAKELFIAADAGGSNGYPIGKKVSEKEMRSLNIEPDRFHGDWNYTIHPREVAA